MNGTKYSRTTQYTLHSGFLFVLIFARCYVRLSKATLRQMSTHYVEWVRKSFQDINLRNRVTTSISLIWRKSFRRKAAKLQNKIIEGFWRSLIHTLTSPSSYSHFPFRFDLQYYKISSKIVGTFECIRIIRFKLYFCLQSPAWNE